MQQYADFFRTLHDETGPVGRLGRGTHYSVMRAAVFHDALGRSLRKARLTDFAIIWDEDHDMRVMDVIGEIYRRGLLSSFFMFGERKGMFTAVLSDKVVEPFPFNPDFLTSVENLKLSARSSRCLEFAQIGYVGELVQKTEAELLRVVPVLAHKGLDEIKEALAQRRLRLEMEVPDWEPERVGELISQRDRQRDRISFLGTEINEICQSLDDPWASSVLELADDHNPIIDDDAARVSLYLNNIRMLWQLGIVRN
jgi:hypothetical protein